MNARLAIPEGYSQIYTQTTVPFVSFIFQKNWAALLWQQHQYILFRGASRDLNPGITIKVSLQHVQFFFFFIECSCPRLPCQSVKDLSATLLLGFFQFVTCSRKRCRWNSFLMWTTQLFWFGLIIHQNGEQTTATECCRFWLLFLAYQISLPACLLLKRDVFPHLFFRKQERLDWNTTENLLLQIEGQIESKNKPKNPGVISTENVFFFLNFLLGDLGSVSKLFIYF